jgi:hypothetical protein
MATSRFNIGVWTLGLRLVAPLLGLSTYITYWQPSSKPHRLYYSGRLTEVLWPGVSSNLYLLLTLYWLAVVSAIFLIFALRIAEPLSLETIALISTVGCLIPVTQSAMVFTEAFTQAFAAGAKGYFAILT